MKKLIGNFFWLVTLCLMLAAHTYPQLAGIAQSLLWVFLILLIIAVPCIIAAVLQVEKKEQLETYAKKKSWFSIACGWIKTFVMFAAIAFAGFTVAAGFYLMLSLIARLVRPIAQSRLEKEFA